MPKASKKFGFKNQQSKVRLAARLPKEKTDSQLTNKTGDYVWNNKIAEANQMSNNVDYNAEEGPYLITNKVEIKDGKLAGNVVNANIINTKTVAFNIFNQYNNFGKTQYMTDTDQLLKDTKVDLKYVKVYLADDQMSATTSTDSSSKADDHNEC